VRSQDPSAEFIEFFEANHKGLLRFAFLLTGDADTADDLLADALVQIWQRWDRVSLAEHRLAYVRRIVVNLAGSHTRRLIRDRKRMESLRVISVTSVKAANSEVTLDVRVALHLLPARKRACVVLRYAFDLSERETAAILGISTGTVKSQTAKAVSELRRHLGDQVQRQHAGVGAVLGGP
jgi:RNA polymerase sigma-70 factor (sigma-E family)